MASYSFLGHPYVTPISIIDEAPVFVTDTLNLRRQSVHQGAQRWRFNITFLEAMGSSLMTDFMAHYRQNFVSTFTIPVPQNFQLADNLFSKGTAAVNLSASFPVNATTITVNSTNNFQIPTGWMVKFAGHNKLYMVTSGMTAAANSASLVISPGLTSQAAGGSELIIEDVVATVRYNTDTSGQYTYTRGIQQRLSQEFIEYLS